MISARQPGNEADRLEALCAMHILDTPPDERFDRITRLAAALFKVPIALVSLVDEKRQWFKSRYGLSVPETGRDISFCAHVVYEDSPLFVPDATEDPRFESNPLVLGNPNIRFYAGYPVKSPEGHVLGTLCIVDTRRRDPSEIDMQQFADLARLVEEELAKGAIAQGTVNRHKEIDSAFQRLATHVHNSPLAVIEWDDAFRITRWSKRAEEMFGWTASEVLAKHPADWSFIHQEDRAAVEDVIGRLLDQAEPRNVSLHRNYRKDGSVMHCTWHNSALFAPDGSLLSVLSLVEDVSAQTMAEVRLRESEANFRATFEQAAVGIAHVGLDGSWQWVNSKLCRLVGYGQEELSAMQVRDIIHPSDLHIDRVQAAHMLDGVIETYSVEKRCRHRDGHVFWIQLTASLRRAQDRSPMHFILVVEDIQQRKQAEQALQKAHEDLEARVEQRTLELKRSNEILAFEIAQRQEAEATKEAKEELLDAVLESIDVGIVACDGNGRLTLFNRTTSELHGLPSMDLGPDEWAEHYDLYDGDGITPLGKEQVPLYRALQGEVVKNAEMSIVARNAPARHLLASGRTLFSKSGRKLGAVVAMRDITDRKRIEMRHAESEHRLRTIANNLPVLIAYIDREQRFRFSNATYESWLGLSSSAMQGKTVAEVLGPEIYATRTELIARALNGEQVTFDAEMETRQGLRDLEFVYIPHREVDGKVRGVYALGTDVTAVKAVERQLTLLARHDALTGLPNRRCLEEKLTEALGRSHRSGNALALMFIDIDHFKGLNDSMGHAAGDEVLREFARRLRRSVRSTDTVARLGGDEFVVLLEGTRLPAEALQIAEKILETVRAPLDVLGLQTDVTASIGLAVKMSPEGQGFGLMEAADEALYRAKAAGRNTVRVSALRGDESSAAMDQTNPEGERHKSA